MARLKSVDQLAIDEQAIEDDTLLTALESWQNAKEEAAAAGRVARKEKKTATDLLAALDITIGTAARVGHFRVTHDLIPEEDRTIHVGAKDRFAVKLVLD